MQLRSYQQEAVDNIREAFKTDKRVLCYLPQGSGKSIVISEIAMQAAKRGTKVVVLTHRDEILSQNMNKMEIQGVNATIINAKTRGIPDADVYVAMAQTLSSRLKRNNNYRLWIDREIKLFLVDEAHREEHSYIIDLLSDDIFICGFSATILRSGQSRQLADHYSKIISGPIPRDLVWHRYLTPAKHYIFDAPKLTNVEYSYSTGDYVQTGLQKIFGNKARYSGILENWLKICPNSKTIIFTTGTEHGIDLCNEFFTNGIKSAFIGSNRVELGGSTIQLSRKEVLEKFYGGEITVLVNVYVLDTGFDCPDIETVILDFATTSFARYSQAIGRGSRLSNGKTHFKVLDFGGNTEKFGIFESNNIPMSLWHTSGGNGIPMTKECLGCGRLVPISTIDCKWCGHHWETEKEIYDIELSEYIERNKGTELQQWVAEKVKENEIKPRKNFNNWLLVQICQKNPDNKKKAFEEAVEVLRNNHGSQISKKYWWYFKKNILQKVKREK